MTYPRRRLTLAFSAVVVSLALAACGGSHTAAIAPSSSLVPATGGSAAHILLTAQGAQRIGVRTTRTRSVSPRSHGGATVVIPPSAIVYDPSGRTYAFVSPGPLSFVAVAVSVERISGDSAYLRKGPRAGSNVVIVGAEELLGVQTGVRAQS